MGEGREGGKRERRGKGGRKGGGVKMGRRNGCWGIDTGALNLQGIEFARKGGGNCKERIFKEKPHNSHPCEFARNGFIKKSRSGIHKE